ncbi:Uncharacterized protein Rs2_45571 [Raphanus sativus]|nr:Uncharacterized protein Rs2_45571 [Raphanus sativus]
MGLDMILLGSKEISFCNWCYGSNSAQKIASQEPSVNSTAITKMRKSPWIGFKMNWRNQSYWVEYWVEYDQKANIEAGESVADDEAKYGRVKGPSHIFHKKF